MHADSPPKMQLDVGATQDASRRGRREALGFVLVGAVGFCVDAGFLTAFNRALSLNIYGARILSFSVAVVVTWILNTLFTFQSRHSLSLPGFARYLLTQSAGALINISVFSLAVHESALMAAYPIFAVVISSLTAMAFNFYVLKKYVYKTSTTTLESGA